MENAKAESKKRTGEEMTNELLKDVCTLKHADFLEKYFGKRRKQKSEHEVWVQVINQARQEERERLIAEAKNFEGKELTLNQTKILEAICESFQDYRIADAEREKELKQKGRLEVLKEIEEFECQICHKLLKEHIEGHNYFNLRPKDFEALKKKFTKDEMFEVCNQDDKGNLLSGNNQLTDET